MSKYKICIIIPYFGKFLNYFDLFLKSCEINPSIDFLIFTDDKGIYNYPSNVKVEYCEFFQINQRIQQIFKLSISMHNPYKLCDFRPAYGVIFKDYLKNYDFWGYCDTDLIFGDIRQFITDDILDRFNKILQRGHFSLIRNKKEYCEMFKKNYKNNLLYKEIFSDSKNRTFDEKFHSEGGGINGIFEDNGIEIYKADEFIADINIKFKNFLVNSDKNKLDSIFVFKDNRLIRKIVNNGVILDKEYLYIHLQKRKMNVDKKIYESKYNEFIIIPNKFIIFHKSNLNYKKICEFSKKRFIYIDYIKIRYKNFLKKIALN